MNKKVVVIFIEGDTEVEFYRELIQIMRGHCGGRLSCQVETVNASGIGRYQRKVARIFENQIKPKYPDASFHIALCYDQDVFELDKNPPVNWSNVKNELISGGAKEVVQIKAVHSIEDWFMADPEGVLRYLKLPPDTRIPSATGANQLKTLFKKASKLYIKGKQSAGFVKALDIKKILSANCRSLAPLCRLLGVNCKDRKKCGPRDE